MNPSAAGYENTRVLVTGGLGFIGSNLARRLVASGARVTLVDSLIPEYGGNQFNIAGIADRVTVNIADVRDPYSMKCLVEGIDLLYNLAGQTSHMDSMKDPFTDLDINSRAQLSILEACRQRNPEVKVVYASTRQIYGRPQYLPVDERHPLQPIDVNGVNKLAGEQFHRLYNDVYGIRSCVLRLTNTIGPRMRIKDSRQTFLGVWVNALLERRPIEVWGGNQLRDFTDVNDCVEALLLAGNSPAADGQVFNLGGNGVISLKDLAALMIEINGFGSMTVKAFPDNRKRIDIGDYYADCRQIQDALGWVPRTPIQQTLQDIIDYYRRHMEHYR